MALRNKSTPAPPRPRSLPTLAAASTRTGRHQRQILKKFFNLNMLWNGSLYRRFNRWENSWTLTHNPLNEYDDIDNDELITSFSNPNYTLITDDALNSNLPSTQYYNDNSSHIYDNICSPDSTNQMIMELDDSKGSAKSRKKYADMDLTMMGIELPSANHEKRHLPNSNGNIINTPDSVASIDSEGQDSAYSGCITSPEEKTGDIVQVEHNEDDTEDEMDWKPKGFLGYYASLERNSKAAHRQGREKCSQERESIAGLTPNSPHGKDNKDRYDDKTKVINSPDSNDSGIQADVPHIHGPINDDIYAVVQKPKQKPKPSLPVQEEEEEDSEDSLPPGWEKHEDEDGPYYWHIKSGTIQRDPPPPPPPERQISSLSETSATSNDYERTQLNTSIEQPTTPDVKEPQQEQHLQEFESHAFKYAAESIKSLSKDKDEKEKFHWSHNKETGELPIRFAVRSLGWVQIPEEDLTPEKSSKAVNKCIVDLSLGRNDINDVVGRWGDGKDLYMDLDEQSLVLIDPQDVSVLNLQPVQSIRVWGVGRDNGRDFAYVARDRVTRKHMCHVFRCDTPARQIANTLRDICQKIMLERSKGLVSDGDHSLTHRSLAITRPNNLPVGQLPDGQKITFESLFNNTSFPTPMEEPKKVIRCHYLGTAQVARPTGKAPHSVEVLNGAAEKVYSRVPPEKWVFVSVAIAPSTITITEHGVFVNIMQIPHKKPDNILAECRVRFLSFMGIAQKNVKLCSFIMHTAQDQFVGHVFHCEPSAGALCKTIEAACKLRYQKCLDSHLNQQPDADKKSTAHHSKGIGASLKQGMQNVFGSIGKTKGRKTKS